MQLNFFIEIAFVLNSNTLYIYACLFWPLWRGVLLVLFAKGQFSFFFAAIVFFAEYWCVQVCEQMKHAASILWFFTSSINARIFIPCYLFKKVDRTVTALSVNFAINTVAICCMLNFAINTTSMLYVFLKSQLSTMKGLFWPVLVQVFTS